MNKGNNKITELQTILQRESQNSYVYKQTKSEYDSDVSSAKNLERL